MKIAVLSDVHGNLPALIKALEIINNINDVNFYIFLGDIVGYGPWSNECVETISKIKNSAKIVGNHEEYFINRKCEKANVILQNFFKHSFKNFVHFNEIKQYKKEFVLENIKFKHTINNKYVYKDTKVKLSENIVIGHSHYQYKKIDNNFFLINPGSVGQNRENIKKLEFAIIDTKNLETLFISQEYDYKLLINEMRLKKYPDICINYYLNKLK